MKRISYFYSLPVILLIFILAGCGKRSATVDTESEKAKIDSVMNMGFTAVEQQNWEDLSKCISDDWSFYTHLGNKMNLDQLRDLYPKNIKDHNINISNKKFEFSKGGDFGWVTFDVNASLTFRDSSQNVNAIFTAIFEKQNDEWKMVHLHRSVNERIIHSQIK